MLLAPHQQSQNVALSKTLEICCEAWAGLQARVFFTCFAIVLFHSLLYV